MKIPLIAPYLKLLKNNPPYRWLWLSQVISLIGDWFNFIATTTLISALSGSGLAIGFLLVARMLPMLLLGPVVGVIADRFNRRNILIISDVLRVFVVLGFLLVKTEQDIWLIYTLTLLQLSISAFFGPTRTALVPSVVPKEDLITANAIDSATWSSMLALGAALGGLATALFGVTAAFLIDAFTFILSAWCVTKVIIPAKKMSIEAQLVSTDHITDTEASAEASTEAKKQNTKSKRSLPALLKLIAQKGAGDYIDGLRYLWQRPHTFALTVVKAAAAISYGAMDITQVIFAERIFRIGDDSSATLGLIYAAIGLGTGIGPLVAQRISGTKPLAMRQLIAWAFVLNLIGYIGISLSYSLPLLLISTTIRGIGTGIGWVYSAAILQMTVPDKFMGRVFALELAMLTLCTVTTAILAGYAIDNLGFSVYKVAALSGVVAFGVLITWVVYHQFYVRQLKGKKEVTIA